jgi:RimJ/RimL family protein N-acetyltransferase
VLVTPRLRLLPVTTDLVRAEMRDREAFARLLGAAVPPDWPPEMLADALPWFLAQLTADHANNGWLAWYGIVDGDAPALAASGGFMGPPVEGVVAIGYSVLPAYREKGYATEMMTALVDWAFAQPGVTRVAAEALPENLPSVRLLHRLSFVEVGDGAEAGYRRFERTRR